MWDMGGSQLRLGGSYDHYLESVFVVLEMGIVFSVFYFLGFGRNRFRKILIHIKCGKEICQIKLS